MSIWQKYPHISDTELRTLVAITAQELLATQTSAQFPDDILETSPRAASRELLPLLQQTKPGISEQHIHQLLENPATSRDICLQILEEIQKYPDLAQQIADTYEHEARMMDGEVVLLLVGGLVILALKIKEIHLTNVKTEKGSKKEIKLAFYESAEAVRQFITKLIKGI